MLLRLLNWVPVLFGLNVAGVASAATLPEVPVASSGKTDAIAQHERKSSGRTASGTLVTRLMVSTSMAPVPNEQTAAAKILDSDDGNAVTAATERKRFVARPIAVAPPRPTARIEAARASRKPKVVRQPGQVKQGNRPTARANLKAEGKKIAKRVVWTSARNTVATTASNVIPFPAPLQQKPLMCAA